MTLPIFQIPTRGEGRQVGHHIAIAQDADVIRIRVARTLIVVNLNGHTFANAIIAKTATDKTEGCGAVSLDHERQSVRAIRAAMNPENEPGVHRRVRANGDRAGQERGPDLIRQVRSQPQHPARDRGVAVQGQTAGAGEVREVLTECLRLDGPGKIFEI